MEQNQGGFLASGNADNNSTSPIVIADLAQTLEGNAPSLGTTNSEIIRQTLRLYGCFYLAILLVFCYVRRKFPTLFNIRSWVDYGGLRCELAETQTYGFISWIWKVFQVDDDQLLKNCGMDGLCFLRCLRLGTKLSLVGCINAIWLIPTFYTAEGLANVEKDKFVLMSVANLNPSSPRFAAVVVSAVDTRFRVLAFGKGNILIWGFCRASSLFITRLQCTLQSSRRCTCCRRSTIGILSIDTSS